MKPNSRVLGHPVALERPSKVGGFRLRPGGSRGNHVGSIDGERHDERGRVGQRTTCIGLQKAFPESPVAVRREPDRPHSVVSLRDLRARHHSGEQRRSSSEKGLDLGAEVGGVGTRGRSVPGQRE